MPTLKVSLPHPENKDYEEYFEVDLMQNYLQITHLDLLFRKDKSYSGGLRTLEHKFDRHKGSLIKVNFYRRDFREPNFNWSKDIFYPNVRSIVAEAENKAYRSVERIKNYLEAGCFRDPDNQQIQKTLELILKAK